MMDSGKNNWLILFLVVLGVGSLFFASVRNKTFAKAGFDTERGISGSISVVPLQIGRDSFGIAMVDSVGKNLWIYEVNSRGPAQSRLKLIAARSFEYDMLLEQFNTAEPWPETVKKLLFDLQESDDDVSPQEDVDDKEPNKSVL